MGAAYVSHIKTWPERHRRLACETTPMARRLLPGGGSERALLPLLSLLADHSRETVHSPGELEIQQANVGPGTEPFVEGGVQILFLAGHSQRGHAAGRGWVCVVRVRNAV